MRVKSSRHAIVQTTHMRSSKKSTWGDDSRTVHNLPARFTVESIDNSKFQYGARHFIDRLGIVMMFMVIFIVTACSVIRFFQSGSVANDNGVTKRDLRVTLNPQYFSKQNGTAKAAVQNTNQCLETANKVDEEAIGGIIILIPQCRIGTSIT